MALTTYRIDVEGKAEKGGKGRTLKLGTVRFLPRGMSTAEREKRALIAASEGRRQEQINIATGEREAFIARCSASSSSMRRLPPMSWSSVAVLDSM